jgi:hypothetical protein
MTGSAPENAPDAKTDGLPRCSSLWIGESLGPIERACLRSVLRQGHPMSLYCYKEPRGVPAGVEIEDAALVFPRDQMIRYRKGGSTAIFANRFRYELQRRGLGIWVDCDVYLLAPIIFDEPHLFGWESADLINSAVFRLPQDSPLLGPLLELFEDKIVPPWLSRRARIAAHARRLLGRGGIARMPWGTTGPHAVTALARKAGLDRLALPRETFYPVHWGEAGWIKDPSAKLEEKVTPHTVAVHLWNEHIKTFKNAPAAEGSFLQRLQAEGGLEGDGRSSAAGSQAPSLSVVLPVHNGLPYVEDSIRSILAQTFTDFEFVIGDDGSTDGTSAVLQAWAERDPRIRLVRREQKSGLAGGANWVITQARAPLIAIAHADDLSHPDRLRRQVELLSEEPEIDLVGTLWNGVDEEGRQVRPGDYWRLVRRSPFAPFSHSSAMFRRASFERVGGYRDEAEYWEDLDLYFRIAASGRVAVLPEVLSTVRHARVSTRLRNEQARVEDAVDLMYRSTAEYRGGGDHTPLLRNAGRSRGGDKLHPMTFVSCGSTSLWSGRSPGVMKRMWQRAGFGPNFASAQALVWVTWGTLSPRSLRLFLRTLLHIRNVPAKLALGDKRFIEWRPRDPHPAPRADSVPKSQTGSG